MSQPFALIIEDEPKLSNIFAASLKAVGFITETIMDGREAQQDLASRQEAPDLIVLDLHLPQVSGEVLLNDIRNNDMLKDVRVLMVTADQLMGESLRKDADLLLLKPISVVQMQRLATRLIEKRRSTAASE